MARAHSRRKMDPAVSRKAYNDAEMRLKQAHREEYLGYVEESYVAQGVESPKAYRDRLAAEKDARQGARAAARAAKEQAKIDEAAALLRAAGIEVALPVPVVDDNDPQF